MAGDACGVRARRDLIEQSAIARRAFETEKSERTEPIAHAHDDDVATGAQAGAVRQRVRGGPDLEAAAMNPEENGALRIRLAGGRPHRHV